MEEFLKFEKLWKWKIFSARNSIKYLHIPFRWNSEIVKWGNGERYFETQPSIRVARIRFNIFLIKWKIFLPISLSNWTKRNNGWAKNTAYIKQKSVWQNKEAINYMRKGFSVLSFLNKIFLFARAEGNLFAWEKAASTKVHSSINWLGLCKRSKHLVVQWNSLFVFLRLKRSFLLNT